LTQENPGTPVCLGCTEAQEWQRVQAGYGTLEQEPI
jgi:hypothetical protein